MVIGSHGPPRVVKIVPLVRRGVTGVSFYWARAPQSRGITFAFVLLFLVFFKILLFLFIDTFSWRIDEEALFSFKGILTYQCCNY